MDTDRHGSLSEAVELSVGVLSERYLGTLLKLTKARMINSARGTFLAGVCLPSAIVLPIDGLERLAASFPVVLTLSVLRHACM